jgi:hypothetical protein
MERYALDANAIRQDFRFERAPGRLLLREAREERIKLIVPRVALDEAVNLMREEVSERSTEVDRARRKLDRLGALRHGDLRLSISPDEAGAAYEGELRAILDSAGAEYLPYPDVSHEVVARRAMDRRRPFDAAGRDGYRDTLLWETLLEAASHEEPIVLVSGDNAAFSPNKGPGLLKELQDELEARGLPRDAVRRIKQITDFTSELPLVPDLEVDVEHALAQPIVARLLGESLAEEVGAYEESTPRIPGFPLEVDQLFVDWVGDARDLDITAARELDDGTVAVEMTADVAVSLELYVWKYDAYTYEGDDFRISDHDYNESFVEGHLGRRVLVEFEAIYDPQESTFAGVDVLNLEILEP